LTIQFVIDEFRWPPGAREKVLVKHGLDPEAVEDSFFRREARARRQGDRYILFSTTPASDYILVVFAYRVRVATVITARQMTDSERRGFKRK
jgi:uncharacterized DUF497 family protein